MQDDISLICRKPLHLQHDETTIINWSSYFRSWKNDFYDGTVACAEKTWLTGTAI